MAEIKFNSGFSTEVDAFRSTGPGLDEVRVFDISTGGLSLQTVDAYQNRLYSIRNVMIKFEVLVKKDAADMDALADTLKAADNAGG